MFPGLSIIPLQKDFSHDVVAIGNIKNSYREKMIAKGKFSSTLSTLNSVVTQKGVSSCNIYTFSTTKVIAGEKRKKHRGDAF